MVQDKCMPLRSYYSKSILEQIQKQLFLVFSWLFCISFLFSSYELSILLIISPVHTCQHTIVRYFQIFHFFDLLLLLSEILFLTPIIVNRYEFSSDVIQDKGIPFIQQMLLDNVLSRSTGKRQKQSVDNGSVIDIMANFNKLTADIEIKGNCQRDGEQQLQWEQMMAHSPGYPTDIDKQPDREERSQEKQRDFVTWQLR